jgi:arsenate reductase
VGTVTVYVHPTCSKSHAVIDLLTARHTPFEAVNYLETPPGAETIGRLLDMLDGEPAHLVRVGDHRFTELALSEADVSDRAGVIAVLVAHPELMQRPVLVSGNRAVVARPPDRILALLAEAT